MLNGREVKNDLQVRRFAAVGLIKKQQAGGLTGEEAAMLREYMADPYIRGFATEAIKHEIAADARAIAEAYKAAKAATAHGSTEGPADPSLEDEVALIVNTYKAIKGAAGSTLPAAGNMTAEELEAKKIADYYQGKAPQDTNPEMQLVVDAYKGQLPKESTVEIDELLKIHNSQQVQPSGSK